MKHRHILTLFSVALPICVLLRAIQMFFTIDSATGFIKQQYSAISVIITIIICATVASIGLLTTTLDDVKQNADKQRPVVAIASALAGGMFIYQTVEGFAKIGNTWYDTALVILTFASAIVFVAYGLKNIYEYKMPSITLVFPVVYYILKLISLFVSTSALALVTENIFLIFTNSVMLWFMFEFASFKNLIGDVNKRPKRLFASGLAATILCAVMSLPKLVLPASGSAQLSGEDISAALLNMAMGIFTLIYIVCNFGNNTKKQKGVGKHSA